MRNFDLKPKTSHSSNSARRASPSGLQYLNSGFRLEEQPLSVRILASGAKPFHQMVL